MKSVLDRSFQYTPAVETDIKKTFARIRRQLKEEQKERLMADAEAKAKVASIKSGRIIAAV